MCQKVVNQEINYAIKTVLSWIKSSAKYVSHLQFQAVISQ